MNSQRSTWDLGRFVKTLSYFGAIPFLSSVDWFQQLWGSRPDPKVDSGTIAQPTNTVLLVHLPDRVQQSLKAQLAKWGYRVRSLVAAHQPTMSEEGVEQVAMNLSPDTTLPASLLNGVQSVITVPENAVALAAVIQAIAAAPGTQIPIFDFSHPAFDLKDIWGAIDDVVMGGVSESQMRLLDGVALFAGTVSTANSGGFASVRTRNLEPPLNLTAAEGIELRVKGDGQRYKCLVRCEDRWDGVAYSYSFDTIADTWTTIRIPFTDLIPVFRAKTMPEAGPLKADRIMAFQLMLSKFEYDGALNPHFTPGFFQLQIESIAAYGHSSPQIVLIGQMDAATIEASKTQLQQANLPYTILHAALLTDDSGGRSLIARSGELLQGQINPTDLATICVGAIAKLQSRQLTLSLAEDAAGYPAADWNTLFSQLQP